VIRDVELVLVELLQNELPIDEIIDRLQPDLLDLRIEVRALQLLARRHFGRADQLAHLRKRDHVLVHHGGDAVEDLLRLRGDVAGEKK